MKSGILGATLLITTTTIDDAVWLVPYCTSSHLPLSTKIIHGLTFICTLEFLSIGCILFYYGMKSGVQKTLVVVHNNEHSDVDVGVDVDADGVIDSGATDDTANTTQTDLIGFYTECIGALICWSIAIFLFVKKMLKRRRKRKMKLLEEQQRQQQQQQQQQKEEEEVQQRKQQEQQIMNEKNKQEAETSNIKDKSKQQIVPSEEKQYLLSSSTTGTQTSIPTLGQHAIHSYTFMSMDTTTTISNADDNGAHEEEVEVVMGMGVLGETPPPAQSTTSNDSSISVREDEEEQVNLVTNMNDVVPLEKKIDSSNHNGNDDNNDGDDDGDDDDDINTIPTKPSIPVIITFTTLGALDEISYFPALLMGNIFTPTELCVGAFFASVIILVVITLFLAQCKPLVDCLDRIPLYGIVGMFAVILTVGLFF